MCAVAVGACGSTGGQTAALNRPPSPVNLSVYVSGSRVSVSPASVGAGPVVFVVTNQASRAVALAISRGARTLASTAPINPQGTTQVMVDMKPGTYTVAPGTQGENDAQRSEPQGIAAATVHVGRHRPSSSNQLLQP